MKNGLIKLLQTIRDKAGSRGIGNFRNNRPSLRASPKRILIYAGTGFCLIYFLYLMFAPSPKVASQTKAGTEEKWTRKEEFTGDGVKELTDPRALWVADTQDRFAEEVAKIETKYRQQQEEANSAVAGLKAELANLKEKMEKQEQNRLLPDGGEQEAKLPEKNLLPFMPKKLGHVSRTYRLPKKDTIDYLPSGSTARAVVMMGVVVGTGAKASGSPKPIMVRLTDKGIFSNGNRIGQIKDATLIGECTGSISSERAECRMNKMSFVNRHGEVIERKIEAWIVGEDGAYGAQGLVVDKSSEQIRMAALNGLLGGMAGFFQNQASKSVYPISPFTGPSHALSAKDSLKSGLASGAGNALEEIAKYGIARAEQMSPVIIFSARREVDILFKEGVQLREMPEEQEETSLLQTAAAVNTSSAYGANDQVRPITQIDGRKQAGAFADVLEGLKDQEEQEF